MEWQCSGGIWGFGLNFMADVLYQITTSSAQQNCEVSVMNNSCIEKNELTVRTHSLSRATYIES